MSNDDSFCFYCQRQYASKANLVRHIERQHPGTYAHTHVARADALRREMERVGREMDDYQTEWRRQAAASE